MVMLGWGRMVFLIPLFQDPSMKKIVGCAYVMVFLVFLVHSDGLAQQSSIGKASSKSSSIFRALQKQLETSKQNPDQPKKIVQSHLKLGEYYHSLGLYSEAMEQYNKALDQLGTDFNDTLFITLNNNIGKVYLSLNNFELAEQHFTETLNASKLIKNNRGLAMSLGLLGASHEKQGEYDEALKDQKESLLLFEKMGDQYGVAMTNENIGSIHEDLEQFDLAYQYFNRAYQYLQGKGTVEEVNVLNNLGDSYRKTGNYAAALEKTSMALEVAQRLKDFHQLESAHKDLSKTYAFLGDFEKAHAHLLQAEEFNSAMLRAQNTDQLNVLQTIYETNKKEAEIQLLKEQNKVSRANQNLLWVALFAIASILTILYNYLGRKRKAKLKIQEYKQRMLKAEMETKPIE